MRFEARELNQLEIDKGNDAQVLAMMRTIYPSLKDEQLIEAKESLERYLKLAWRIADRIIRDSENPTFDNPSYSSYDTQTKVEQNTPSALNQ